MVGSGRDKDYSHDGISHWSEDDKKVLSLFDNIDMYHPDNNEELELMMNNIFKTSINSPSYLNLRR